MKKGPWFQSVPAVIASLTILGIYSISATPVSRGFVSETPREFEYNTGFLNAGDSVSDAFSVFGAYPGLFDAIHTGYFPDMPWGNDSEIVVGTFNFSSFYWSGDHIAGSGQFFDFGTHPLLTVTATFQNAILDTSIENINVRGYYSGRIENDHALAVQVSDPGSTLALLGGSLVLGLSVWVSKRRTEG